MPKLFNSKVIFVICILNNTFLNEINILLYVWYAIAHSHIISPTS